MFIVPHLSSYPLKEQPRGESLGLLHLCGIVHKAEEKYKRKKERKKDVTSEG
jgi:hypothetical protein